MADFREYFEAYGGDYEETMGRFMGKESFYLRLLDMLFEDPNLKLLEEALRAGQLSSAFEAAHTLKGAVGNMGLTPLFQSVCAIVEPLRVGEHRQDYPALYEDIRSEFQKADALRSSLKEVCRE